MTATTNGVVKQQKNSLWVMTLSFQGRELSYSLGALSLALVNTLSIGLETTTELGMI